MAIKTITLAADKEFKYKLSTDSGFTTLAGGITHTIEVEEGSTIELKSSELVSAIKVGGDVKSVNIHKSAISNLQGAFKDTDRLETVIVNTSVPITNMDSTFKNSGVKEFDIETEAVTDFDNTFENATRIQEVDIDTSNAETMNATFSGALSLVAIRHILPFKGNNVFNILKGTDKLEELSGIDLTYVDDVGELPNSPALKPLGLYLRDGKPQERKLYLVRSDMIADPNYTFEMDYNFREEDGTLGRTVSEVPVDLDNSTTVGYTFEMDYSFREEDGTPSRTVQYLPYRPSIEKDNGYTFEMDYEFNTKYMQLSRSYTEYDVDKFSIVTLDTNINSNYTFEMDIVPDYTIN